MSLITSHAISASLIGCGAVVWALAGRPLVQNPQLDAPLNPLGINGSPYGEVFAMAMQGPIDTYFNGATGGLGHAHPNGAENCEICKAARATSVSAVVEKPSFTQRFENFLISLSSAEEVRTNPKAASGAHKRYLRRQVEDKLRFAYQLDPSHYANYNALHFFLTEPELGTRPELTPSAAKLAEDTIQYCLKQENDPRPLLTAAAACTNVLQLMFNDQKTPRPKFTVSQMRQQLTMLDHCIASYFVAAKRWDDTKGWDLLSPQRIAECDERISFITQIRDTSEKTIIRFESTPTAEGFSN